MTNGTHRRPGGAAALLALMTLAFSGGCGSDPFAPVPPDTLVPDAPDVRLLEADHSTGFLEPLRVALSTEAEWLEVWDQWTGQSDMPPAPPAVDFGEEMVVVAAMGGRPTGGYTIGIERVDRRDGRIFVVVFTVSPGEGCAVTLAPTSPAIAVALPASDTPVSFLTIEYEQDC